MRVNRALGRHRSIFIEMIHAYDDMHEVERQELLQQIELWKGATAVIGCAACAFLMAFILVVVS